MGDGKGRGEMAAETLIPAYDKLPEQVKGSILALSILIERISSLSKADRDDLFALLEAWREASDPEEQREIRKGMEEILAQLPVRATRLPLEAPPLGHKSKTWAAHVGKTIREYRTNAHLTQDQLAKKAGIDQAHISRIENAEHTPTHLTLKKIAAALRIEVRKIDPCLD